MIAGPNPRKPENPIRIRGCSLSAVVFLAALLFTLGAWQITLNIALREAQANFDAHAQDVRMVIKNRLQSYEHILMGGAGLFAAVGDVSRSQWGTYVGELQIAKYYPGIQGIGYSKVVAPSEREALIAAVRKEGFPEFDLNPPGERDTYTSIIYINPFSGRNLRAFGYDMFSEPTRRAAMERARDTGLPCMSGKVTLVQENDAKKQAGMLVYVPVYRKGAPVSTVEERRAAIQGFVYSPFRMDDLMRGILGERHDPLVTLHIYDGTSTDAAELMHSSGANGASGGKFVRISQIGLGGHAWTIRVQGTSHFESMIDTDRPFFVLIGGLLGSTLILAFFSSLQSSRNRAVQLAARMTENLRDSEERYSRAVSGTNDGIWDWELGTGKTYYSPRFIELMGYAAEEFPPQLASVDKLLHPEDRPRIQAALRAHWQAHAPYDAEARFLTNDRGYRYFRVKGQALHGPDGRVLTMAGSFSDVTDRKEAEFALLTSEQRFRTLVEHAPVGIYLSDLHGNCEFVNDWWVELTGMLPEQARGEGWARALHPEDRERVAREWNAAVEAGRQFSLEYRFLKNGKVVWVSGDAIALTDAEGSTTGYIGTLFDLTERMRVEQLKNEFISTVSHELRTPLTSIRGSLGLVLGGAAGDISEKTAKLLAIAASNSERLVRLINDILDIAKLESGELQIDVLDCEVQTLLDQAVIFNQAYAAQFQVRLACTEKLPGAFAQLDPDRSLQVLTNLISNAVKFSPAGACVDISLMRNGRRLRVEVIDRGDGIPEEFHQRIFQKFAQADSSDTRAKGGTGLGLNISKAIVERQGGTIGFASKVACGTTFYIEFPELLDAEPVSGDHRASEPAGTGHVLGCEDGRDVAMLPPPIPKKED